MPGITVPHNGYHHAIKANTMDWFLVNDLAIIIPAALILGVTLWLWHRNRAGGQKFTNKNDKQ